eukprot:TRINITY_DN8818_c0_g2_i2.p1 TRINITY_DN8818_c0_g2~~TRINITY_DN8818_c0_g2_i2.p1  ORF type:complete len:198 (-),score=42.58 TRINITY_DN8818_c0_g2_i2:117-710(-)
MSFARIQTEEEQRKIFTQVQIQNMVQKQQHAKKNQILKSAWESNHDTSNIYFTDIQKEQTIQQAGRGKMTVQSQGSGSVKPVEDGRGFWDYALEEDVEPSVQPESTPESPGLEHPLAAWCHAEARKLLGPGYDPKVVTGLLPKTSPKNIKNFVREHWGTTPPCTQFAENFISLSQGGNFRTGQNPPQKNLPRASSPR